MVAPSEALNFCKCGKGGVIHDLNSLGNDATLLKFNSLLKGSTLLKYVKSCGLPPTLRPTTYRSDLTKNEAGRAHLSLPSQILPQNPPDMKLSLVYFGLHITP
jgi:hypothetical protein